MSQRLKGQKVKGLKDKKFFLFYPFIHLSFYLLVLISQLSTRSFLYGAFEDPYWSARVAGLAGAFTAVSDDATGIFYNPAATVKILTHESHFSYAKLFASLKEVDLSLSHFSYVQSIGRLARIGIGWGSFNSADLYREDTIIATYTRDLKTIFPVNSNELSIGISVRYLMRKFVLDDRTIADPVFRRGNRSHVATFDLHLFWVPDPEILPGISSGISVKSLTKPDIGFSEKERLPLEVVGGIQYQWKNIALPIDIAHRSNKIVPHFGLEAFWFDRRFVLRSGTDLSQVGGGFGYSHFLTTKFSIAFEYGFLWPLQQIEGSKGSHRGTFGVKF